MPEALLRATVRDSDFSVQESYLSGERDRPGECVHNMLPVPRGVPPGAICHGGLPDAMHERGPGE